MTFADELKKVSVEGLKTNPDKLLNPARSLEADYKTAIAGHQGGHFELISEEDYLQRRRTCLNCENRNTCPVRGCDRWRVLVQKIRKCPENRW